MAKTTKKSPIAVPVKVPKMEKAFPIGKKKGSGKSKSKGC